MQQTRKSMKRIFLTTLFLWLFSSSFLSAQILINELMQSNIDLVRDGLQEFPDSWIELYNHSDQTVNIRNWTVADNADYQKGWKITSSISIPPKSYQLIYADKASTGVHTHFRLDSGNGGAVYLFNTSGQQIDAVENIPKQPAPNIAYGRIDDGNPSWAHFVTATPGAGNTGKTSNILLSSPVFSKKGGIFTSSVRVGLSLPANVPAEITESNIHYTLNNSEPTLDSPSYTGELNISKTTVVRAKLIHPDYLTNWSKVHTYIISKQEFSLPVISISVDSTYLWDEEFGIYCKGNGTYGKIDLGTDYPANWNNNWRRPVNFEYFPSESNLSVLNQLCEMRIAGGWSRMNPQKSFIVYANKRFGEKRFDYDLFGEKPGQEIKSFMIRNSGSDFWYAHFRDAAIQLFFGGKVDVDYQAYQPAIFYLNGNYWGIQNLRERSDEDFVLANYATEDVDVIKSWWDLKAGDLVAFNQLRNEVRKSASQRNNQWIMSQIDVDEFINYMILQIYVANTDFLSDYNNNTVMWRMRNAKGRWRFILKDTDQGLGIWNMNPVTYNALNIQYDNDTWRLFNALLTQDSFKKNFYGRFAIYMGDLLHYKSTSQLIDSMQALIEPAMPAHLNFWQNHDYEDFGIQRMWWRDMNSWRGEVAVMKNWCNKRNVEVYKHLRDYFKLGTIMRLTFEPSSDITGNPAVFINGVRMRDSGLDASYFQGEKIELRYGGSSPLYGWEITKTVNGATSVETYFQQEVSYQIADGCTFVKIKLIDTIDSLSSSELSEIAFSVSNNQLHISNLRLPSVVSIYDMSGKLVAQTSATDHSTHIPFRQKGVFIVTVCNEGQRFTQKIVN